MINKLSMRGYRCRPKDMYLVRRPRLGRRRLGEPVVTFSFPWPAGVRHLYVVSEFTAFFPGRVELRRHGDRGLATVRLREGVYRYFYVDSLYRAYEDFEAAPREETEVWKFKVMAAVLDAGVGGLKEAASEGGIHWELVLHDESWPSYFSGYGGVRVLRLFTVRGEFDEVSARVLTDDGWLEYPGLLVTRDDYRDYYEVRVPRPDVRAYAFDLSEGRRSYTFGFDGPGSDSPWVPPQVSDEVPWFVGTTYYLVFVDSFASSSGPFKVAGRRPRERLGGDLRGLAGRLGYLRDLGIRAVYLTPIYRAGSYHRYDVIDQSKVDDDLGGDEAFQELVSRAHEDGIRVVLDVVVHHTSPCAREFLEALERGPASRTWDWYRFLEDDWVRLREAVYSAIGDYIRGGCRGRPSPPGGARPPYETFAGVWSMPKLNHLNDGVLRRLCDVLRHWASRGVDGFRIDVAHGVPDGFLQSLFSCAQEGAERPFIMEVIGPASVYSMGEVGNSAMNYEAYGVILDFLKGKASACEASHRLNLEYLRLPLKVANSMYNLIGSHDTPRIADVLGGPRLVERAFALETYIFGAPSVYYGDEVGMRGGQDPDNRLPMQWDEGYWDLDLRDAVSRLLHLKVSLAPLRLGAFRAACVNDDTLKVIREWGVELAVAIVSRSRSYVGQELRSLNALGCRILLERGLDGEELDGHLLAACKAPNTNIVPG